MKGTVYRRGSKWTYVVDVGQHPDGRRKQKSKGGFQTKGLAQDALTEVLSALNKGAYVEPTKQTVEQFMREWLPSVRHSVEPKTWTYYKETTEYYIIPKLGHVRLKNLNFRMLNSLYSELMQSGGKNGKGLSAWTVRHVHAVLHRALADAELPFNPAAKAKPPKVSSAVKEVWDEDTLQLFLIRARDTDDYAAYLTLASTGMRREELLALRKQDVDLARKTISIPDSKSQAGVRQIPLDEGTTSALRWHIAELPAAQLLLFEGATGNTFTRRFTRRVKAWGLPELSPHGLRHTHASLLLKAGVHPKIVQERLGHSSIQVTLDLYSHFIPGIQEQAADAMESILWGANKTAN